MKISTILDHIDSGHMALPEFQRGYVWNREQVRGLMASLYRRHPVGSLLVWATSSAGAEHRGDGELAAGVVKLLLDGQQRITSLYGIIRGEAPAFFDGNNETFTGLHFHLEREEFAFYSPISMKDDPLWTNVSALMQGGNDGLGALASAIGADVSLAPKLGDYIGRLNTLLGIRDIDLHVEEVTGQDKTIDVVVDIFNRVNSGGTKLSQGDLALAKICADWPEAREQMKTAIRTWESSGYHFNLDWFLRNINTVAMGEAKFLHLHQADAPTLQQGVKNAERAINSILNLIGGRVGLDHDRVLFGRYAIPVMSHYMHRKGGTLKAKEQDQLLYWYVHSALWGRFSGSTESTIDKDLQTIEDLDGGIERLIEQLRLSHGSLQVVPGHFAGWGTGTRFYPMLYMLTRMGEAKDLGTGLPLKNHMLGKMSRLEVHHIFPKKVLYGNNFQKSQVNAVANYCFLTKDTNLKIRARLPSEYLPEVEFKQPGTLSSQWIPEDPHLWRPENYLDFLRARQELLAKAANAFLNRLGHDLAVETTASHSQLPVVEHIEQAYEVSGAERIPGGIDTQEEETQIEELVSWLSDHELPTGNMAYELVDASNGNPLAVLDLAWPNGLQAGFSQPVALLLNEGPATLAAASSQGYRFFTSVDLFQSYVTQEILAEEEGEPIEHNSRDSAPWIVDSKHWHLNQKCTPTIRDFVIELDHLLNTRFPVTETSWAQRNYISYSIRGKRVLLHTRKKVIRLWFTIENGNYKAEDLTVRLNLTEGSSSRASGQHKNENLFELKEFGGDSQRLSLRLNADYDLKNEQFLGFLDEVLA